MKTFNVLIFSLTLFFVNNLSAKKFIIDDLTNPGTTYQGQRWSFITDGVMGGLSTGKAIITDENGTSCYKMFGNVTTKNNGGFIQIRTPIFPNIDTKKFDGIYLKARGNNKEYSIHLRTSISAGYWQYYSYSFFLKENFVELKIPFIEFKKSNIDQPNLLFGQYIKSIGLVAGFKNFYSNVCLSEIGFF